MSMRLLFLGAGRGLLGDGAVFEVGLKNDAGSFRSRIGFSAMLGSGGEGCRTGEDRCVGGVHVR